MTTVKISKTNTLAVCVLCILALAGCDKPKPRHLPFDPMSVSPPPSTPAAPN